MKRSVLASFFVVCSLIFLISQAYSTGDLSSVSLVILPSSLQIYINSPLNETINVISGCFDPIIELNASANFDVDNWWYTLEDLKHNQIVQSDVPLPSLSLTTTVSNITVVRWQNRLTIFANGSTGVANKSVIFYVNTPNHAPILGALDSNKLVCESQQLSYPINASDCDEDNLNFGVETNGIFFLEDRLTTNNIIPGIGTLAQNQIFSTPLLKSQLGTYTLNVSVADGALSDRNNMSVTVIEVNNPPQYSVFIPGANTVWTQGENSTFSMGFTANDIEDGNQNSGNLSYNVSFSGPTLFGITGSGNVNYLGNAAHLGNHNVTVCVTDLGIPFSRRHLQLPFVCGQSGSNQSTCVTFQLTVTNENRQPTITAFNPRNLTFPSFSTDNLYFNITTFDPDGTIPDSFWYVDGSLVEYDNLSLFNDFNYNFGCGVSGTHTVQAIISDGLLSDSLQWNVTIIKIDCPVTPTPGSGSGGSGGGGAFFRCTSQWACFDWNVCQNGARSLEIGTLSGDDYRVIKEGCVANKFNTDTCGFQLRSCFDANNCNLTRSKPAEIQSCMFTINPSCTDRIKNCHSGSCEFLVDCGGPCGACATCTDGLQNQGEENIDCGGPCPFTCAAETAQRIGVRNLIKWLIPIGANEHITFRTFFAWFLLLLIITVIILVYRVVRLRKKLRESP